MANESSTIVQRLWNYCNVLRDDGVSYGDYMEQLTYLLFLKMADEQTNPPFNKPSTIPKNHEHPAIPPWYPHLHCESLVFTNGWLRAIFA